MDFYFKSIKHVTYKQCILLSLKCNYEIYVPIKGRHDYASVHKLMQCNSSLFVYVLSVLPSSANIFICQLGITLNLRDNLFTFVHGKFSKSCNRSQNGSTEVDPLRGQT